MYVPTRMGCCVALAVAMALALPAVAQPPEFLSTAQVAPALIRTDSISGAYEVVHWGEAGLIFVASVPSFDKGSAGFIQVLDAATLAPIRQIQLPRRPFALALDRGTGRLYAGNTLDGSLTVIDARGGQVIDTIQLGQPEDEGVEHTRMIALDEARGLAFVTSPGRQGVVWIVDTRAGRLLHRIEGGLWTAGAAYDPAGRFYASGGGTEEISVIDASGQRIGALSTGDTTGTGEDDSRHFFVNLAIDTVGQRLFAADAETGTLHVFDIASGRSVAQVPTGPGTLDVAYNPARGEIYVSWRGVTRDEKAGTGGLTVIDAGDYSVKQRLSLPAHPNSLEVSADGRTLFVTVKAPHDKDHPDYRAGGLDSVLRLDLARLAAAN
ncbi:YncE family protein [Paenirhodobacter sp.]|uniref:YncE family protein n=1 Tax=Paenirhodobacter sp. TaxID=1965326 RepID=UPI003B40EFE5